MFTLQVFSKICVSWNFWQKIYISWLLIRKFQKSSRCIFFTLQVFLFFQTFVFYANFWQKSIFFDYWFIDFGNLKNNQRNFVQLNELFRMVCRTWKSVQRLSLGVVRKIDYLSIIDLLISNFEKITPSLFLTRWALSNDVSHLIIGGVVSSGRVTDRRTD